REQVVPTRADVLAKLPRRKAGDHRVLRMLRWSVRQDGELGDHSKQLFRRVAAAVIDDGAPDRGLVPLEERLEKSYFFPFFLAGGFVVFGAAVDAVPVMPSDSARL